MSTFEWMYAAAKAFYHSEQLFIVALRNDHGRLEAVAPLVRTRNHYLSSVALIGSNYLYEPAGLLFRDPDALRKLVAGLVELGAPLNLKRLAHSPEEIEQITSTCRGGALLFAKKGPGTPFLRISSSWKKYERSISSGRRSDLRRALRRAENFGDIEFEVMTPTLKNQKQCFEDLVRVELNSWKGHIGSAMGLNRKYYDFFSDFSQSCAQRGLAKFGFMRINGKSVAANFSVQYGRAFWTLKVGYDEKYSRCSPGILLMHEMVRYAFEQELDSFEFLGEPEKWIQLWSPQVMSSPSLRIFPKSVRGVSQLGIVAAGAGLRMSKNITKHSLNYFMGDGAVKTGIPSKGRL
jgi:CelD/BcsL family acetyltransferase involved in cellulose biosynthesis